MASFEKDLQRIWLFGDLSQRQLKRLSRSFRERTFKPGTRMLSEGKMSGVDFFVIIEGAASVSVNGKEVEQLGPGDHFGELATIDGGPRAATVRAGTELRCLILTDAVFRELVHDHPATAWKLLLHLAGVVRAQISRGLA